MAVRKCKKAVRLIQIIKKIPPLRKILLTARNKISILIKPPTENKFHTIMQSTSWKHSSQKWRRDRWKQLRKTIQYYLH